MSDNSDSAVISHQTMQQRFAAWGESGLTGHAVPTRHTGKGDGFQALVAAHSAYGQRCEDSGLLLALNAHLWGAVFPLLSHGTPEQQQYWLPDLVQGRVIGGHAITEPQAGSDLAGLQTEAVAVEKGYRLNGHKRWITNTPYADLLVVYARLDQQLSAFLVCATDEGVDFQTGPAVDACHNAGMGDVLLHDCLLPHDRLLGCAGNGQLMVQQALELERAFIFAGISGVMQAQLKTVTKAVRKRRVAGKPLAQQQLIAHRIADMRTRLDTLSLWVEQCATLADAGKRITLASSQTKLLGAEYFLQSSLDAVQLLGAAGLQLDAPGMHWVQDALASRLFSGSSEVQKNIIAGMLGLGG